MTSKEEFLSQTCGFKSFATTPMKQDASSRRYWRIETGGESYVLMDGDAKANKFFEFVQLSKLLMKLGVCCPQVVFKDFDSGFLLIDDLGDDTFTCLINKNYDEKKLYKLATDVLIKTSKLTENPDYIPELDDKKIVDDICLFVDWYYPLATSKPLGDDKREEFIKIVKNLLPLAKKVPNSIVLWDYHVDNLMLLRDGETCAVLDYQDALWGPVGYDIMSLLEDARRDVPSDVQNDMKELFVAALDGVSREDFEDSYKFFAVFRHMRVLGRFSILMAKHNKDTYLKHIPHIWKMLDRALEYPKFLSMKKWLDENFASELRGLPKRKPITKAMILAAGRGTRMKNLTDERPKPLIEVKGKSLIRYKLDMVKEANIKDVVVNVCYHGDKIKNYLKKYSDFNFTFSDEEEALETGGGVKKALPLLGSEAFFTINSDELWKDTKHKSAMWRMMDVWDDEKYDILLLLVPLEKVREKDLGLGNYLIDENGKLHRNVDKESGFDYFYPGTAIVHPRVFNGVDEEKFSMRILYDEAEKKGRLGYVILDEDVYHVGTPEDLGFANREF